MANNISNREQWIIPTSIALTILVSLYFFVLFPKDASVVLYQSITYLVIVLITILTVFLISLIYQRTVRNNSFQEVVKSNKNEKKVEQLIWRNRYVLQAQKARIMSDPTEENQQLWMDEKTKFARKYIFPEISETDISLKMVIDLIETSLRGGSIGGIRPPTYNVKHSNN